MLTGKVVTANLHYRHSARLAPRTRLQWTCWVSGLLPPDSALVARMRDVDGDRASQSGVCPAPVGSLGGTALNRRSHTAHT